MKRCKSICCVFAMALGLSYGVSTDTQAASSVKVIDGSQLTKDAESIGYNQKVARGEDLLTGYSKIVRLGPGEIYAGGITLAAHEVERIGISRAWTEIEQADRIILMLDSSDPDSQNIEKVRSEFLSKLPNNMLVTIVRNKVDLSGEAVGLKEENGTTTICLSAQTHKGVDLLRENLKQAMCFQTGMEGGFLARRRHLDALEKAAEHLQIGLVQLTEFHAGELLAGELRLVQANLSENTGQFTSDDLLGNIFSSFCIGK